MSDYKQVVATHGSGSATPADLLAIAVEQGADLAKLEKLMDLQERWEEREARKAYIEAMTAFKSAPIKIEKDAKVKYSTSKGVTEYDHASLANVVTVINTELAKHGLSAGWKTTQDKGGITVTCTITHCLGHSESTNLTAPPDDSGGKNSIQAIASTISYLERYTILALAGLATHGQDDDGRGSSVEYISEEQENTIMSLIEDNELNSGGKYLPRLLGFMSSDSISQIHKKDYKKCIDAINIAIKNRQANA